VNASMPNYPSMPRRMLSEIAEVYTASSRVREADASCVLLQKQGGSGGQAPGCLFFEARNQVALLAITDELLCAVDLMESPLGRDLCSIPVTLGNTSSSHLAFL
jgi:hypothetical protein